MSKPVVIAGLLLVVCSWANATEMKITRDVPYADTKNERQTLDVYAPATGDNHPILFWIHGGGWQAGSKEQVDAKPQAFVDRGFVFVSTNYRLLPNATINEMAQDVANAIAWVVDHAKQHGGDAETIVVAGHSAGAQLAALICIDDRYLKNAGVSPGVLQACVPVDGDTYDVPMQISDSTDRVAGIYRRKFGDQASQKDLSPVTHVGKNKQTPPVLILHVDGHPQTTAQSRRLVTALTKAGFTASAFAAKNRDHKSLNTQLGQPDDPASEAMFTFLDRHLKRQ